MSEWLLKTLRKSGDFQAEYEGSVPFTHSKGFRRLPSRHCSIGQEGMFIRTNVRLLFQLPKARHDAAEWRVAHDH